ncbi:MAG: GNAT family N-acetyltransferase [Acidimicrobiales bacterium]
MTSDSSGSGPDLIERHFDEFTARELHDVLRLRTDVFVVEQECAYAELDGRDTEAGSLHVWIERDADIAAYARRLTDPDGTHRIGRVVTHPGHRGRGLAAQLVVHLRDTASGPVALEAQSYLVGWYRGLGFEVAGDEYVEDGIPHVPMALA